MSMIDEVAPCSYRALIRRRKALNKLNTMLQQLLTTTVLTLMLAGMQSGYKLSNKVVICKELDQLENCERFSFLYTIVRR